MAHAVKCPSHPYLIIKETKPGDLERVLILPLSIRLFLQSGIGEFDRSKSVSSKVVGCRFV